jgi:hypothetical protein
MNNYYVYLYKDPISYESFYVGMGKGIRMFHHLKEATSFAHTDPNKRKIRKIQKIIAKGCLPIIIKVKDGITKDEAIFLEKKLISIYGRLDLNTGTLTNLTSGGEGAKDVSEESKEKKKQTFLRRYGAMTTPKMQKKKQDTCTERYGVSTFSKTEKHKIVQKNRLDNLARNGLHWAQQKENKEKLSELAKKQAESGTHPFQSKEYREKQARKCREGNAQKIQRKEVSILKEIYKKLDIKGPMGYWMKSTLWLQEEITRLESINHV